MPDTPLTLANVLSQAERMTLLHGALRGVAPDSLTTEQLARVVAWAEQARIDGILLDRILAGEVIATFKRGDVVFILAETL